MEISTLRGGVLPGRFGRAVIGVAALVTVLCCAGCFLGGDRVTGAQRIGIQLLDGRPAMLLYSCPGHPVTTVTITRHDIHSQTDEVLWKIERTSAATGGESVEEILIGQAPAGYRTTAPLSSPLPSDSLDAGVIRDGFDGVVTFKVADLKAGMLRVDASWYSQHHSVDREHFLSVNRKNC
jgi:hypothetical protein